MRPTLKRSREYLVFVRYHKAFQWLITTGIVATTTFAYFVPHLSMEAMVFNAFTNLVWVWEPRNTL